MTGLRFFRPEVDRRYESRLLRYIVYIIVDNYHPPKSRPILYAWTLLLMEPGCHVEGMLVRICDICRHICRHYLYVLSSIQVSVVVHHRRPEAYAR
jgi:hypothetical protein